MAREIAIPTNQAKLREFAIRSAKRAARVAEENKDRIENATGLAIAFGASYVYGVVEDKLPGNGKIPGTEIGFDLAGGMAMAFAGAFMRSKAAMPLMFAGIGLASPALREYGRQAEFF